MVILIQMQIQDFFSYVNGTILGSFAYFDNNLFINGEGALGEIFALAAPFVSEMERLSF